MVEQVAELIRESKDSVAVHFRRGDYVRTANFFEQGKGLPRDEFDRKKREWLEKIGPNIPLSLDYYYNAIEVLKSKFSNLELFIFSDDIASVKKEFRPSCKHYFVEERFHAHDTMRLMSLCHHAVIANSSFSWWAAWLNPLSSKAVIAPAPWFSNDPILDENIVPESWIRLPAHSGKG